MRLKLLSFATVALGLALLGIPGAASATTLPVGKLLAGVEPAVEKATYYGYRRYGYRHYYRPYYRHYGYRRYYRPYYRHYGYRRYYRPYYRPYYRHHYYGYRRHHGYRHW